MTPSPVTVTVTGAAGQIGYALLFRIAAGEMLGPDTPVVAAQNGIPWWYFHGLAGPWAGRRVEAVDPGGAVSAVLPPARAVGLVVYFGASIVAPGVVETRPEAGLVVGEPDGTASPLVNSDALSFVAPPDKPTGLKVVGTPGANQTTVTWDGVYCSSGSSAEYQFSFSPSDDTTYPIQTANTIKVNNPSDTGTATWNTATGWTRPSSQRASSASASASTGNSTPSTMRSPNHTLARRCVRPCSVRTTSQGAQRDDCAGRLDVPRRMNA